MEQKRTRRAFFFDRDGVVNLRVVGDYIRAPEQFRLLPDVGEALLRAHDEGYLAVVITNQRGIARGMMSAESVDKVHSTMQATLEERVGDRFDAIYLCPHGTDDQCDCRKPKPGMLLAAAREIGIDLSKSWIIGDSTSDVEAGRRAGCSTAYLETGVDEEVRADVIGRSLEEIIDKIFGAQRSGNQAT